VVENIGTASSRVNRGVPHTRPARAVGSILPIAAAADAQKPRRQRMDEVFDFPGV
jgi:hypothetical protein